MIPFKFVPYCWIEKKKAKWYCISCKMNLYDAREEKKNSVIPPGIEPGTLSVLDSRDNHYTTESLHNDCAKKNEFL